MKKALKELMLLAPGRVDIEINRHLLHNETAKDVIERRKQQFGINADAMIKKNTIIMVEAACITKRMPTVISFHYDLELAIKDCLKQISEWQEK